MKKIATTTRPAAAKATRETCVASAVYSAPPPASASSASRS
jgi:hypothetical protein